MSYHMPSRLQTSKHPKPYSSALTDLANEGAPLLSLRSTAARALSTS
jgi:hypothetical protein